MTRWLTLDEFRQICFDYAATADWIELEPIPDFDTRYPNRLESCLETPQQTFDEELLYPTLYKQATIFFYLLVKNHPFLNGNKRIAIVALGVFLFINVKLLKSTSSELYDLTKHVASSDPKDKTKIMVEIEGFIDLKTVTLTPELYEELQQLRT